MVIADCPACMLGDHSKHVETWGTRSFGIIDGEVCRCSGDCAERGKRFFDELFRHVGKEALSPDARVLVNAITGSDPALHDDAVRRLNALMEADPLPDIRDAEGGES